MVKQGYKQTEIGVIPEDWECVMLPNLLNEKSDSIKIGPFGSQLKKEYLLDRGEYCVYGQENVYANSFLSCYRFLTKERFEQLKSCEILPKDFLISTMGTIGKCAIAPLNIKKGIMDSHLLRLRFCDEINQKFFKYYFSSDIIQRQIKILSVGGIMSGLSSKIIKNLKVVKFKIQEQEKIAEALSDTDNLISSLEKLIEKKKAIKQGAMQNLLTGKTRLPGFMGEWKEKKFGTLCNIVRGGSPRPIQDYLTNSDRGVNWIKIGDVKPNEKYIEKTEEKIIEQGVSHSRQVFVGDFILSNSMSFGRPYILKIDGCIHDGWLAIQDYQENFDKDFLYYLLGSEVVFSQYIQMAAGSSVQNLNKEKVSKLLVVVPSLEEQKLIADILSDMDNEIKRLEQKLAKTRLIKQGMMQQLLTGKIRLV